MSLSHTSPLHITPSHSPTDMQPHCCRRSTFNTPLRSSLVNKHMGPFCEWCGFITGGSYHPNEKVTKDPLGSGSMTNMFCCHSYCPQLTLGIRRGSMGECPSLQQEAAIPESTRCLWAVYYSQNHSHLLLDTNNQTLPTEENSEVTDFVGETEKKLKKTQQYFQMTCGKVFF